MRSTSLLLLLASCSATAGQRARTAGRGVVQVGLEGGVGTNPTNEGEPVPLADVAVRVGLTDRTDVGGRLGGSGVEVQGKHRVTADTSDLVVSAFVGSATRSLAGAATADPPRARRAVVPKRPGRRHLSSSSTFLPAPAAPSCWVPPAATLTSRAPPPFPSIGSMPGAPWATRCPSGDRSRSCPRSGCYRACAATPSPTRARSPVPSAAPTTLASPSSSDNASPRELLLSPVRSPRPPHRHA